MKQLTIRGVSEELHRKLRSGADQHDVSVNRYVLAIIKKQLGYSDHGALPEAEYDDLDYLAGTWSQQQYQELRDFLQVQRTIDADLWQ